MDRACGYGVPLEEFAIIVGSTSVLSKQQCKELIDVLKARIKRHEGGDDNV